MWKFFRFVYQNAEPGAGSGGGTPPEPTSPTQPGGEPPEDISGLKSALAKERDGATALRRQLAQLQEQVKGIDPAKYAQLEELQKRAEEWNQKEVELRTRYESEWVTKVKAEQERANQFEQRLLDLTMRTQAEKAYQAAGGRNGAGDDGTTFFDAFFTNVQKSLRLNEKGTEVEVVDASGARLFSKKDSTKPMTAAEYFSSMAKHPVFGHYFAPQQPGKGGGMQPNSTTITPQVDLSNLGRSERLAILRRQRQ